MNRVELAFLICTIAGMTTMLGCILVFKKINNINSFIASSLSFTAGIIITVSLIDLIPEAVTHFKTTLPKDKYLIILVLSISVGIIISHLISKIKIKEKKEVNTSLYKVGIVSMIALMLHNMPEGITTYIASSLDIKLGINMAIIIALHNIPEGISISIPIYLATKSKSKAILYTFISGISELFGAVITHFFLYKYINNINLGILLGITSGIMIYIGIFELLKTSITKKEYKKTIIYFLIGTLFIIIKSFF